MNWLVPDLVTALMTAPEARPHSASNWLVRICTSCDRFVRRARLPADVRSALFVGVVRAVEHDVVGRGRLTVGLEAVVQELGARDEHRARHVADKRHVVAAGRRQIAELFARDVAADRRRGDVDQRRFAGDRQRFGESADFHHQIERRRLTDGEREIRDDRAP